MGSRIWLFWVDSHWWPPYLAQWHHPQPLHDPQICCWFISGRRAWHMLPQCRGGNSDYPSVAWASPMNHTYSHQQYTMVGIVNSTINGQHFQKTVQILTSLWPVIPCQLLQQGQWHGMSIPACIISIKSSPWVICCTPLPHTWQGSWNGTD